DGVLLNRFTQDHADQPRTLHKLAQLWLRLSRNLRAAGIAHGDLQHGNVLLAAGARPGTVAFRLVDYDGLWVPALASLPAAQHGHPCFQHPRRAAENVTGPDVDRFSLLVVYTALLGLAAGRGREHWSRYDNGENMLFRAEDFTAPSQSSLLRTLWDL